MDLIRGQVRLLIAVVMALAGGWVRIVARIGALLHAMLDDARRRMRLPGRLHKVPDQRCVPLKEPAYKRPDPMIYDQRYLMAQGLAVTWNNPDITLRRGGVTVGEDTLLPATDYEIVARIWNLSPDAPVIGLAIVVSYMSFGAGTVTHHIADTTVDLGVKGGPGCPAFATVKWRTPPSPGHYCLMVRIDCFDDANPNNNLGQNNVDVIAAHSPAVGTFLLRNDDKVRHTYHFAVDAYTLGELPPCDARRPPAPGRQRGDRSEPGTLTHVPPAHAAGSHPVPAGWTVDVAPEQLVLAPGQEQTITATITPPDTFAGEQAINVNALDEQDRLEGGVTFLVSAT
jgi:hypothetical protein